MKKFYDVNIIWIGENMKDIVEDATIEVTSVEQDRILQKELFNSGKVNNKYCLTDGRVISGDQVIGIYI